GLDPEENWLPPHQIMFFLEDEYAVSHFSYLLIVGHPKDIALGYFLFTERSDYEYSRVAGIDNWPDIGVGRFSVTRVSELQNMINKSIAFQSSPPPGNWLVKSLMIAGYDYATLDASFQDCSNDIIEPTWRIGAPRKTYSVLHPDFITAYGAAYEDGGDEATNEDVINYINEGCRFVNYRGHGSVLGWEEWSIDHDRFYIGSCNGLDNGQKTPVVFAIANGTLYFDLNSGERTLGEAFTSCREDGAAAYLGATSYTEDWIMNPHAGNYYNRHFYKAVFQKGINAAGDASTYAALATIEYFYDHLCRRFFWLGDPSLQLIYNEDAQELARDGSTASKNVPDEMPGRVELYANYPNPFNPSTDIPFNLPHACHVNLQVFNIMGQKIATLADRRMEAGNHTVTFDGSKAASGVYLYRLQAGDFVESKKMLLVK
ncbi:MAG: T9SS type A sorting domain-containing protein, partial [Candidatus Zixiibacteriota bacterium]